MEGRFRKLDASDRRDGQERRTGSDPEESVYSLVEPQVEPQALEPLTTAEPTPGTEERGIFDWLEAEEREEHRSGHDRRSGTARRGTVRNRFDQRRAIPFSIAPHGELRTADGRHWHCTLWDVSRSGLCLVANGCFDLPLGSELNVALYEVVGLGSVFFSASLRWFANDEFQTYLGLQFLNPVELPQNTFLERYFQAGFDT